MEVLDPGNPSRLTDHTRDGYALTAHAVEKVFPGVIPVPYLLTGASDARFFDRVSDQVLRFLPFTVSDAQMGSIHGLNENLDLSTLAPAVDFYRCMMQEGAGADSE